MIIEILQEMINLLTSLQTVTFRRMTPTHGIIHNVAELRTTLHTPVKLETYGCSNWQLKYGFTKFVAVLKVKGLATRSRLITRQSLISGSMENFTCDKIRSARKIDVENFVLSVRLSADVAITYCRSYDSLTSCKLLHIFLLNKTNRRTEFQFYWYYFSAYIGQPFCTSSRVLSRTPALVHFMQL
jgi:hypothetical protein